MDITDGHRNVITYFIFFTEDTEGGVGTKRGRLGIKMTKICFSGLYNLLVVSQSMKTTH